jgi:hypothetical protein
MLETHIPGPTREKIVVAYYRKSGQASVDNFDEICRLCRSTGCVPFSPTPLLPETTHGASPRLPVYRPPVVLMILFG